MEPHKREIDPRKGRRIGGLIDELRAAAGRLADHRLDLLIRTIHEQEQAHEQETTTHRRSTQGGDQEVRPHLLRSRPGLRRGTECAVEVHVRRSTGQGR